MDDKKNILDMSLKSVAKGTTLVLIGFFVYSFFFLISKLLIARFWTQSDFGVFSLAFSILNIFVAVTLLGLDRGVARNIAFYQGKKNYEVVPRILVSSLLLSMTSSVLVGILLFFSSDLLASRVFNEPGLVVPLKIFSVSLPFFTLIQIMVSVLRGFNNIKPLVYFQYILQSGLFTFFILYPIFFKSPFIYVFYAFTASLTVTFILLFLYMFIRYRGMITRRSFSMVTTKNILFFSLPLVGTAFLQKIIRWTDILMLGGLKTAVEVGLYNSARSISMFISFPLSAMLLTYTPILSGLFGAGRINETRRSYVVLTKWLCFSTLPFFLVIFLFPEQIIVFLYGKPYGVAANVLRILSVGAILNNFSGPNGATLIAMGKPRFIMYASTATFFINLAGNFVLIPIYGIEGAAVSSAFAMVLINVLKCYKLYRLNGTHPLNVKIIKPSIFLILIAFLLHDIIDFLGFTPIWFIPVFLTLLYTLFFLVAAATKSLDDEELRVLKNIKMRIKKISGFFH